MDTITTQVIKTVTKMSRSNTFQFGILTIFFSFLKKRLQSRTQSSLNSFCLLSIIGFLIYSYIVFKYRETFLKLNNQYQNLFKSFCSSIKSKISSNSSICLLIQFVCNTFGASCPSNLRGSSKFQINLKVFYKLLSAFCTDL